LGSAQQIRPFSASGRSKASSTAVTGGANLVLGPHRFANLQVKRARDMNEIICPHCGKAFRIDEDD